MAQKIRIKLVKSSNNSQKNQKLTLLGLGLKKINQERILENSPSVRGMLNKVQHLLEIELVN
ncbi:MAG: 50S ribosomal protein L30 [SAR324 cluster bacterium]|nr:50S ribosomal protein L30 [SAR324 cluster bacterium]